MSELLPYDKTSRESILAHARVLLGKSLRTLYPEAKVNASGRGGLGQAVEKYHFHYEPNSEAQPDFSEANLELKCSPLKQLGDGSTVAKERLVLNIINYREEVDKDFKSSSFWKKNEAVLLMFYMHQCGVRREDLLFKLIRNWEIPAEDLKIFEDDWNKIHEKIVSGHAHEIHEGDTFYLAACEKGSSAGAEMREQPGTKIMAQQRAYSIKKCYMDQIVLESLLHPEMISGVNITPAKRKQILKKRSEFGSIVRSLSQYQSEETFEELVIRRFRAYVGMTAAEIASHLEVEISSPKSMSFALCRAILGVKERRIAEFEKAGVILKTIRLDCNGGLKESMSFSTIKYCEIVKEEIWEESEWHDILTHKFFFVIFRKSANDVDEEAILEDVFFWSMPMSDLILAKAFWEDTRDRVRNGDYEHFIKSAEHPVCHVRPKAHNAADTTLTPQGFYEKKKCYWLNRPYVLQIVKDHVRSGLNFEPEILQDVGVALRYREYLPLYALKAACGKFGAEEIAEPEGWVKVKGCRARNEMLYVVRAVGHSMEPRIKNGEYKVFEFRNGACDNGDIVLAEHVGVVDSETSGAFSIKKFWERKEDNERVEVKLLPVNRNYQPILLENEGEYVHDYRIVGTLRDEIRLAQNPS